MTNAPHPPASASSLPGDADSVRVGRKPIARRLLPKLTDIPIPVGVRVDDNWFPSTVELADWIGPYDALLVVEALGGEQIYVPRNPARSPFQGILSADKIAIMANIYGGSRFHVPTGTKELYRARRAGVIAAVRAGTITGREGAIIIGTSRSHMSTLANHSDEGLGVEPTVFPDPAGLAMLKRAAAEATASLGAAGVDPAIAANVWAAIMAIWDQPTPPPPASSSLAPDPVLASFTDIEGPLHDA